MYDNSYSKLLKDIAATKPLSKKEETSLFELYSKNRNKLIRDKIVQLAIKGIIEPRYDKIYVGNSCVARKRTG